MLKFAIVSILLLERRRVAIFFGRFGILVEQLFGGENEQIVGSCCWQVVYAGLREDSDLSEALWRCQISPKNGYVVVR